MSKYYIQRRKSGWIVGRNGEAGMIRGGMEMLGQLDHQPEAGWNDWILEHFGDGEYLVTTQGDKGRIMSVFSGPVCERAYA